MKYTAAMDALRSYVVPGGHPGVFLFPEGGMQEIYDCIVANRLRTCLELGTGFGATSCVMGVAAAGTGGKVVTVDLSLHEPVNVRSLKAHVGIGDELEVVIDPLGYNWYLADLIAKQTVNGVCRPIFDFCFLDGAHEWQPDALAVCLAVKLLKPGGWFVLDDLDFKLRVMPTWKESHGHLSDRELDAFQLKMVWDLVVRQHPELTGFNVTGNGRIGWARKAARPARQDSFEELREELEKARAELSEARARIAAMEMSFFWKLRNAWWSLKGGFAGGASSSEGAALPAVDPGLVHVPGFEPVRFRGLALERGAAAVDIVVLAHEDLPVLKECLGALLRHARPPYTLFLADPGVGFAAPGWLEVFARDQGATPVDGGGAFKKAVDAGASRHVLLVDGRVRVAADVLDRLIACLAADGKAVAVVPLAADIPGAGPVVERAARELVGGRGAGFEADPATLFAAESARLFPPLEEGGGCAFLVRRDALPEGAERSPRELLAVVRAGKKRVILADDAWVEGAALADGGSPNRVVSGIAARLSILPERIGLRERARRRWEGKRVLYVLPVLERGGGSNVVLSEARAMARMGVEARVFNLSGHRAVFEKSYPAPGVPIVYGREFDLVEAAQGFDAVIGTAHYSVPWMVPLAKLSRPPVLGYCIQDYEPFFYAEGSDDWKRAFASYGLVPGMKRFSKSKWNADEVVARTGLDCALVSASFDAEVFRPRLPEPPASPVRIAAMVRPSTPRRQPGLTVDVMRALAGKLGDRVEIVLFGAEKPDPAMRPYRLDFPHRFAGVLDDRQLSALLSQVHVFADLSTYQALGVASLEAMASGAAVVVPMAGGADTFARHEVNALAVDTSSPDACVACLERLATDGPLLGRLAAQAIADAGLHTPDRAAAGILEVLFAEA